MKIVAIAGSPRKKGNSTSLMRLALEGAQERGATAEVFSAKDLNVAGCLACESCKRAADAVCVQKDDMHAVYAAIKDADALLLASPVYFYGLSSQIKAVVDRCYALMPFEGVPQGEQAVPRIAPGKGLYVITTQADTRCSTATRSVDHRLRHDLARHETGRPACRDRSAGRRRLEGARRPDRRGARADRGLRSGGGSLDGGPGGKGTGERATDEDE